MTLRHTAALALSVVALVAGASTAYADDIVETVHLVIVGGPNAGTWDASSDKGGCSAGLTGAGSWGNQLSSPKDKDPAKFNSLQLIVPDAKKALSGSKEFFIKVGFGPLMQRSAEYTVETRAAEAKKTGSGTVTVQDKGATALVTFSVTTAAGVKLDGSIDCKQVMRQ